MNWSPIIAICIISIIYSCGHKVNIAGNPRASVEGNIGLQPSFKEAAEFCDSRYGKKTKEAESCFSDFRNYYSIKISLDLDAIEAYCETHYTPNKIDQCTDDLQSLFKTGNGGGNKK